MKAITFTLLMLFSITASAVGYKACYTGNWYEFNGEGISLDVVSSERIVGQFYGYATDNRNRWYSLDAGASGRGTLYTTDNGMRLADIGSFSLDFVDNDTVIFVFDIDYDIDEPGWCLATAQCTGERVMTRITQPIDCE